VAAEAGVIDDVILPEETRDRLIDALATLGHEGGANARR
jgi:acetyl-CoA carboxylase carboxyltransferase component